jgi:hypothetical protein
MLDTEAVGTCYEMEQNTDYVKSVFSLLASIQISVVTSARVPVFLFIAISQSRASVVRVVTRLLAEHPRYRGSITGRCSISLKRSNRLWGPTISVQWVPLVLSVCVKRPGRGALPSFHHLRLHIVHSDSLTSF